VEGAIWADGFGYGKFSIYRDVGANLASLKGKI
jgi:hypothetical protein